ncbi:MAG: TRAP transporter substrate-binding protein [Firmicutes bacterium]|nr:TRAP transporter substrate-binding protein [Bacillota bacterium]
MRKSISILLMLSLILGMVTVPTLADTVTLRLGHLSNTDHLWHKACLKLAKEVKERTDGAVKVEIFPNEILGSERETLEGIRIGAADMTITGETLGNWAPKVGILGAMYLFRDSEHINKIASGPIGNEIEQDILDKANMRVLTWFERGPRYLTSNRPIRTPEDAKGLKMRVPNVPWFIKGWQEIGANPAPMAFSEVFTALQQGVMDAQENPLALIDSAKFYEVQDYVNLTGHIRQWIYLVIGEDQYQSLTAEQQKALQTAADIAHDYYQKLFFKQQDELRASLEEKGMEFIEVDNAAFREKVSNLVYEEFPEYVDLYERIKAVE